MNREELVRTRENSWKQLEALLRRAEGTAGIQRLGPQGISDLAELYRGLAGDLMRLRRDKLGADLERHLDDLAARAHNTLYAGTSVGNQFSFVALLADFPGAVRRNLRFFLLASLLFYGPAIGAGWAAYLDEGYALAVLRPEQLVAIEAMHSTGHADGRSGDADAQMTGFYVYNNIGIAFRCFATGLVLGVGPIIFLISNGLTIGVSVGHLARTGYGENIFSFGAAHGPWELTAIVISGAAGLQMGYAMVSTHGRTRLGHLQAHGLELLRQIVGAGAFLTVAALLEGWYSPSSLAVDVKYATGLLGWTVVALLLAAAGRARPAPPDAQMLQDLRNRAKASTPARIEEAS